MRRVRGFTLVELLAAITSIVVVLSAATGFLITVIARQRAVLEASQLEAVHSQLADIMYDAMKTAEDFQIFPDATRHRVIRSLRAEAENVPTDAILEEIVRGVPLS